MWYIRTLEYYSALNLKRKEILGLPWCSSGKDSALPMQGVRVRSLVGQLDLTCMPQLKSSYAATKKSTWDFPGGAVVKNPPAKAGDTGSSPGPGRSHMPQSN